MEDLASGGTRATLELSFDGPGQWGFAVAREHGVRALGIFIFGVKEETVHVEEACSNR
jgi:hypothetical protein